MADTPAALPEQLIYLIIRFSASVQDLPLSIYTPRTIATLSLKQLIRQHLPAEHAAARLRLIYAGKVLADTEPLATSLRLPAPVRPPPRKKGHDDENGEEKSRKGKEPLRATPSPTIRYDTTPDIPPSARKYYIHCSLGDTLTPTDLLTESNLAQSTETHLSSHYTTTTNAQPHHRPSTSTPAPPPQGFDRLLTSGFTPPEIATLRTHFLTNLAFTHTPDTMPTPLQIRALEERWLDSSAHDPNPASSALETPDAGGGGGGGGGWGAGFAPEEGGLDDMVWGYVMGFFWPLGALVWGFREEGVWTRRRQVAVVMGVGINLVFGFMRWGA
ncbi:hypothetical protein BDW02DRAFT_601665 [Decorospora gaudefroyi]|uniref:Ubiquitin-like domain-containing protein n=1 Tax=Decorospora gaudefroyi TaxID=184978 RepID=A0A6A5JZQ3_9PLEO|nr:hypothetical protein BDW02DRAFT_601665 [Decorospora gaudefroyi]